MQTDEAPLQKIGLDPSKSVVPEWELYDAEMEDAEVCTVKVE